MFFNYQKICQGFLGNLPDRAKDVLERRYGLKNPERETLEAVGKTYGVTRERVRQLEMDGLVRLRGRLNRCQAAIQYLQDVIKQHSDLKKEEPLLELAGASRFRNHIYFLLTAAGEQFMRFGENADFYAFWSINPKAPEAAKKAIGDFVARLKKENRLFPQEELLSRAPFSYIEISKRIKRGPAGLFGLREWPEISPRGAKDRAYVVFKQVQKPLHFTQVAGLINKLEDRGERKALARTVHNELIKDPRFVLVGRGLYALRDWGYQEGDVKDVLEAVLQGAEAPLAREEVVDRVLKQRLVKPSTILLNLNNSQRARKDSQGRYYYVNV